MKLSEIKNEQAIEVLADMFDPIIEIASDENVISAARGNNKVLMVKCDVLTLPMKLLDLFNRPELGFLFQSQGQKMGETSFGSATENTKVGEK